MTNILNKLDQSELKLRSIRSFVRRAGRMTAAQQRAFTEFGAKYLVPFKAQEIDFTSLYQRQADTILEIGFGMGEATSYIAAQQPHNNFLCCEVHKPGIGALLNKVAEYGLNNIRIIEHDATQVLGHMIMPQSLSGVHIFFPDPWHKSKHHKRRLIQPNLIELLVSKLKINGYVHCATDWQDYAEHIFNVLNSCSALTNSVTTNYTPKPNYRPLTKFEQRGINLGHQVWDLVFIKTV